MSLGFGATIMLASIDLVAAYYHIPIAPKQQPQLGFMFDGQKYFANGLPFGAKANPSIFCRYINLIWLFLMTLCIIVFWYVDDCLLIGISESSTARAVEITLQVLKFLNCRVNLAKSETTPLRCIDYIGIVIDLDMWCLRIRKKTLEKLRHLTSRILTPGSTWKVSRLRKRLQSLIGILNFVEVVIRVVRPLKHYFIGYLRSIAGHEVVTLSGEASGYLKVINHLIREHPSAPISTRKLDLLSVHNHSLSTDACETGYGGWAYRADGTVVYFKGLWKDLEGLPSQLSIADKELLTHLMAIMVLLPEVLESVRSVDVFIDNQNCVSWINNLRSTVDIYSEAHLQRMKWLLGYACLQGSESLDIYAHYIPTDENTWADWLSRPDLTKYFHIAISHCNSQQVHIPSQWYNNWMLRCENL